MVFDDNNDESSTSRWRSKRLDSLVGQHSCSLTVNEDLEQSLKQDLQNKCISPKFNDMLVYFFLCLFFVCFILCLFQFNLYSKSL